MRIRTALALSAALTGAPASAGTLQGEIQLLGSCFLTQSETVLTVGPGTVAVATGDLAPFLAETAVFNDLPFDPFSPVDPLFTVVDTQSGDELSFAIDTLEFIVGPGGGAAPPPLRFKGTGHYRLNGFDDTPGVLIIDLILVSCVTSGHDGPFTPPDLSLDPDALDFGTVGIGEQWELRVDLDNAGEQPVEISSIARCPGTSDEYTWSPSAPITARQGEPFTAELYVTYQPVDNGVDEGCLRIFSNDPDQSSIDLPLIGQAPPFLAGTIVLENIGDVDAMVPTGGATVADLSDATGLDFVNGDSDTLAAQVTAGTGSFEEYVSGSVRTIFVNPYTFDPFSGPLTAFEVGSLDFVLESVSLTTQATNELALSGMGHVKRGGARDTPASYLLSSGEYFPSTQRWAFRIEVTTEAEIQDIFVDPASVDFGPGAVGGSRSLDVTLRNLGDTDLEVGPITWCSGTSTEFTWSPTGLLTVYPSTSRILTVTYTPFAEGVDDGCLKIASNDPDENPFELSVSGKGVVCSQSDIVLTSETVDTADEIVACNSVFVGPDVEILQGTLLAGTSVTLDNDVVVHQLTAALDADLLP